LVARLDNSDKIAYDDSALGAEDEREAEGGEAMMDELHLYVWSEVYCYYSYLTMLALAPNVEEARRLIRKEIGENDANGHLEKHLAKHPLFVDPMRGFIVGGGAD